MLASDIIQRARQRLGDELKQRWTDDRMLTIVNDGYRDICKTTNILRKESYIPLRQDQTRYNLPDDCISVRRIEFGGTVMPLVTRNDIDNMNYPTVQNVGLYGIKDNLDMQKIEVYPSVPEGTEKYYTQVQGINTDEDTIIVQRRGVTTGSSVPTLYSVDPLYGVVTDSGTNAITLQTAAPYGEIYSTNLEIQPSNVGTEPTESPTLPGLLLPIPIIPKDARGVLTELLFNETDSHYNILGFITNSRVATLSGQFGITTDIANKEDCLHIFYSCVPEALLSVDSELRMSDIWEAAMLRYTVGTALQDDNDANNINRGELELSKYVVELDKAFKMSSKDYSGSAVAKLNTQYRRV